MSIIRVGLSETKNFAKGYDRIFGKKDRQPGGEDNKSGGDERGPEDKDKEQAQKKE